MAPRRKAASSSEQRIERESQNRQQALPRLEFSDRQCVVCGGGAKPINSVELPEIMGVVGGSVSLEELVRAARAAGFTDDHCYTSMAGISVCRLPRKRAAR
jgi:hypothetical protein